MTRTLQLLMLLVIVSLSANAQNCGLDCSNQGCTPCHYVSNPCVNAPWGFGCVGCDAPCVELKGPMSPEQMTATKLKQQRIKMSAPVYLTDTGDILKTLQTHLSSFRPVPRQNFGLHLPPNHPPLAKVTHVKMAVCNTVR